MQLGEPMEKVLSNIVRTFSVVSVADKVLAQDIGVVIAAHVGSGAEALALTGQHDDHHGRVFLGRSRR